MPEYSNTTITPADNVQVPSMDGSTPGNFALSALRSYILASKGQANGLAGLGSDGKLDPNQIPDSLDDVLVYATRSNFPQTGADGKIYITADNNKMYRWDSNVSDYVVLSVDLSAYATKAELNALSARVSNLEQTTKQGEVTVSYPDDLTYSSIMPNGVPASVAKYGEVGDIRGKTRGWNQLCPINVLSSKTVSDVIITNNSDGSYTLNGTASADIAEYLTGAINLPIGHKILFGYVNLGSAITGLMMRDQYSFAGTWTVDIQTWSSATSAFAVIIASGTVLNNVKIVPIIRDLTLIFGAGNEPSTVAEAVSICPDLLKYDAFGYSLVDTVISGVESVGFNRWDEDFQSGYYWNTGNGAKSSSENWNCSRNKQDCTGGTDYYVYVKNKSTFLIHVLWFDENDNFIGYEGRLSAGIVTSPVDACKFAINIAVEEYGGTTYNHDICINISSSLNGQYFPYEKHTLSLSTPVTLKSAGAVSEVLTMQTGKKTRPVYNINLGSLNWSYSSGCMISQALDIAGKTGSYGSDNNVTCGKYVPRPTRAYSDDYSNYQCGLSVNGTQLVIKDPNYGSSDTAQFKSDMDGVYLNYERNTPDSDQSVCDPIPNNFVKVQANGTINTTQSQSPVIDNCLDVTYDIIPS